MVADCRGKRYPPAPFGDPRRGDLRRGDLRGGYRRAAVGYPRRTDPRRRRRPPPVNRTGGVRDSRESAIRSIAQRRRDGYPVQVWTT